MNDSEVDKLRSEIRRQNDSMQHTINARMEGVLKECDRQSAREARRRDLCEKACAHLSDEQLRGGVVSADLAAAIFEDGEFRRSLWPDTDTRRYCVACAGEEHSGHTPGCIKLKWKAAIEAARKGAGE